LDETEFGLDRWVLGQIFDDVPGCSGALYQVHIMSEHDERILTILRRKQVEVRTGLSRSTIYAMMRDGSFPAPVALGAKAVGWLQSEVEQWIAERIRAYRSGNPEKTLRRRSPIGTVTRQAKRSARPYDEQDGLGAAE
jgi:prophage regulatory protein